MSHKDIVRRFFVGTGASYDFVVKLFTYGADICWKREILKRVPASNRILDLACGTGILTFKIAARFPHSKIVGVDMMPEYITRAQLKKRRPHVSNIQFICGRAEEVSLIATFDCITSSYIPKYVPAERLLTNISKNLRPGGVLILHDFTYPQKSIFRKLWGLHTRMMKAFGPFLFPEWRTVFNELGDFVRSTRWIEQYCETLKRLGYREIQVSPFTFGSSSILTARKPSEKRSNRNQSVESAADCSSSDQKDVVGGC